MGEQKKSTYYAESQKKYNKKFKFISCKVPIERYEQIKGHMELKGFTSFMSYILDLIDKDMYN